MKLEWTARNVVCVIGVILCATAYALAAFGVVHFDFVSNGKLEAYALGAGIGLLWPGSPIGRVLDKVFPKSGPAQQVTADDLRAVVVEVSAGATLDPEATPTEPRPVRIVSKRDGFGTLDALLAVVVAAVLAFFASLLSGCGASALHTQSIASNVTMHVVAAADGIVEAEETRELQACADSSDAGEACIDETRGHYVSLIAALDSLRLAVLAWSDAIGVAAEADAGGEVSDVVLHAARDALGLWPGIVAIAAQLGVTLPPLPPLLVALVSS